MVALVNADAHSNQLHQARTPSNIGTTSHLGRHQLKGHKLARRDAMDMLLAMVVVTMQ